MACEVHLLYHPSTSNVTFKKNSGDHVHWNVHHRPRLGDTNSSNHVRSGRNKVRLLTRGSWHRYESGAIGRDQNAQPLRFCPPGRAQKSPHPKTPGPEQARFRPGRENSWKVLGSNSVLNITYLRCSSLERCPKESRIIESLGTCTRALTGSSACF